jgi:hypothetical protein
VVPHHGDGHEAQTELDEIELELHPAPRSITSDVVGIVPDRGRSATRLGGTRWNVQPVPAGHIDRG